MLSASICVAAVAVERSQLSKDGVAAKSATEQVVFIFFEGEAAVNRN